MTNERIMTIISYEVTPCPRCNKKHSFKLKGFTQRKAEEKVLLFGGATEGTGHKNEILFTCPDTKKKFSWIVPKPADVELIGLASEADITLVTKTASAPVTTDSSFEEWSKKSRDIALDFCKTMLGTSTGSIPTYFLVLKYMGFEKISHTALAKFAILPPILFLVATIFFVLGLRPQYESVSPDVFDAFRNRRLKRLNYLITWGTTILVGALGLAIGMLFYILSQ